jgi:peroxiredoxin
MTQPPANLLLRIEQLLNAGKQQEARLLLVDYIELNPSSARAWWLMSLTLTDIDRQMDCLERVLRLDPQNELARDRLTKLRSQHQVSPSVSPFTSSIMGETEEPAEDVPPMPAWAAPREAKTEPVIPRPAEGQTEPSTLQPTSTESEARASTPPAPIELEPASTVPPAPIEPEAPPSIPSSPIELETPSVVPFVPMDEEASPIMPSAPIEPDKFAIRTPPSIEPEAPATRLPVSNEPEASSTVPPASSEPGGKVSLPRQPNTNWEIVYILLAGLVILAIASIAGYIFIQKKAQDQAQALAQTQMQATDLQETLVVAQTLTSLPLPTLIPTWTSSPTVTALPTSTFTRTPTLTPTLFYTLTKTPRPSSLIGPVVGLYAPDFTLTDLATGQRVSLSQFDGQPVMLFFWATWCTPCNNEMGSVETISQTYKNSGLVVLTINTAESIATVTVYRTAHKLTFPILLDSNSVVQTAYIITAYNMPMHFFINSSGRIASIAKGEMTLDEIKIQADAIIKGVPTTTP